MSIPIFYRPDSRRSVTVLAALTVFVLLGNAAGCGGRGRRLASRRSSG